MKPWGLPIAPPTYPARIRGCRCAQARPPVHRPKALPGRLRQRLISCFAKSTTPSWSVKSMSRQSIRTNFARFIAAIIDAFHNFTDSGISGETIVHRNSAIAPASNKGMFASARNPATGCSYRKCPGRRMTPRLMPRVACASARARRGQRLRSQFRVSAQLKRARSRDRFGHVRACAVNFRLPARRQGMRLSPLKGRQRGSI